MALSEHATEAIVTAAAGTAVVVVARIVLRRAVARYEQAVAARREPDDMARLRTRLAILQRGVVALLALIVVWQVLTVFPETKSLANTVLASGAVLALFLGLALTTPLGNLGAGILLALTQPARLGDRITVGDSTGVVEQLTLIYTVLIDDADRRIFIPNSQMVSSVVVNRTVRDPRRLVTVSLPIGLASPLDRARAAVAGAAAEAGERLEDVSVRLTDLTETTGWLTLSAYAPPGANVPDVTSELRERAVAALARERLLPA